MRDLASDLTRFGGLATRSQLRALGHSPYVIRAAIAHGTVTAIGRDWLAGRDAPPAAMRAVARRGVLGGASALESYGIWVTESTELCIATPHSASRLPPLQPGEFRVWCRSLAPRGAISWRATVDDALAQYIATLVEADHVVATIDSALNRRLIAPSELDRLFARLPRRFRRLRRAVDGRAESGLESLLRRACEREGWHIEIQVTIDGVGRVDLLIDGWLVIEADGSRWHDNREAARRDRARNGALVVRGYRWHRFGYEQVMYDIEGCIRVIRALVAGGPPRVSFA
jgi:very-short-patch-repair endonuclease